LGFAYAEIREEDAERLGRLVREVVEACMKAAVGMCEDAGVADVESLRLTVMAVFLRFLEGLIGAVVEADAKAVMRMVVDEVGGGGGGGG